MSKKLPKTNAIDESIDSQIPAGEVNVRIDSETSAKLKLTLPKGADLPGGSRRVICLSPLARLFNPQVNLDEYLEDPAKIYSEDTFDIIIENSWATKRYRFGESYTVTELDALYLVGTDNQRFERATGGTGFVYFDIPEDLLAAFNYAKKTGKPVDKDIQSELNLYIKQAKDLSQKRVVDFLKDKYNMLYQNRQFIESTGGKPMAPNDMEMLITFILREEINRSNSKRKALRKAWEEANRELSGQA
jgi:hypothetical protein